MFLDRMLAPGWGCSPKDRDRESFEATRVSVSKIAGLASLVQIVQGGKGKRYRA